MKYLPLLALLCACGETKTITVTAPPDPVQTLERAESEFYEAVANAQAAHQRAWRLGSRLHVVFVWQDTTQAPQYLIVRRGE